MQRLQLDAGKMQGGFLRKGFCNQGPMSGSEHWMIWRAMFLVGLYLWFFSRGVCWGRWSEVTRREGD